MLVYVFILCKKIVKFLFFRCSRKNVERLCNLELDNECIYGVISKRIYSFVLENLVFSRYVG